MVTTAHQNASGMDLKKDCSEPASAKYTALEKRMTPETREQRTARSQLAPAKHQHDTTRHDTTQHNTTPQATTACFYTDLRNECAHHGARFWLWSSGLQLRVAFRRNMLPPSTSFILKMEAARSSDTSLTTCPHGTRFRNTRWEYNWYLSWKAQMSCLHHWPTSLEVWRAGNFCG
jgi:hypothetical protein